MSSPTAKAHAAVASTMHAATDDAAAAAVTRAPAVAPPYSGNYVQSKLPYPRHLRPRSPSVDNEIFANEMAGVAVGRGGASRITGNTICGDGTGGSLCLSLHSKGMISSNVIEQAASAKMQVPKSLMPEVREHNKIRLSGTTIAG